ncbi:hypothetical protein PPM_0602 [Paenibacillus polymyxa M1]|nr:hypothetical protein PPM_0602 [Paenibacillus polymyxa M1]
MRINRTTMKVEAAKTNTFLILSATERYNYCDFYSEEGNLVVTSLHKK